MYDTERHAELHQEYMSAIDFMLRQCDALEAMHSCNALCTDDSYVQTCAQIRSPFVELMQKHAGNKSPSEEDWKRLHPQAVNNAHWLLLEIEDSHWSRPDWLEMIQDFHMHLRVMEEWSLVTRPCAASRAASET